VEKTTKRGALCYVFRTEYHSDDQIKKNEMAGHVGCTRYDQQKTGLSAQRLNP